jgi:SAM-dependent methyltransferase
MADVHRSASAGFAARAGTYVQGRPHYPPGIDAWLQAREGLRLGPGATALDLGAGTGKFSGRLLSTGAKVVAVEPVAAMREQLMRLHPGVEVKEGTAQHLPLADASVDAVVCAQSFHWFAGPEALGEIRRVLKPGGTLGLVWNIRDERVAWVAALNRIMEPFEGDAPRYRTGAWRRCFPAKGFGPLSEARFPHGHTGAPERVIVERVLSVSFIAALPASEQERVATQVREVIATSPDLAGQNEVTFPYETAAFHCAKLE